MSEVALDGRMIGRRGAATRRRLLDATTQLLEDHGVRDLRVAEIARVVGTSTATFYQYFRDVEDAVLALAEEVGEDVAPIGELLDGPFDLVTARLLVDRFLSYWDEHRAVLRTRNLAAQEGDRRFRSVRNAALQPLTDRLASRIDEGRAVGRIAAEVSPIAAAAALVAMLERMAAFHADLEPLGATRADVVETTARILVGTVAG